MYLNEHLQTVALQIAAAGFGALAMWACVWYAKRRDDQRRQALREAEQLAAWKEASEREQVVITERLTRATEEEDDRFTTANYGHYRDRLSQAQIRLEVDAAMGRRPLDKAILEFPSEIDIHGSVTRIDRFRLPFKAITANPKAGKP